MANNNVEAECAERTNVSKIKLSDKGSDRSVIFVNAARDDFTKWRVDGCLIRQSTAADWLLSKAGVGHVVVELKGSDVDHAITQVMTTAKLALKRAAEGEKVGALIACTRYPKVDTRVQRGKQAFSKEIGGPLYVVSKNAQFIFEKVLGDDGPGAM